MKGRETLQKPVSVPVAPLVFLVFLVLVELVLLSIGLVLYEAGWRQAQPGPMVTNVQLPDVPGDGS